MAIQKADQGTIAGRYSALETDRQHFLDRAREASKFTIPALIPPMEHNQTSELYKPFQSIGARGVNNLSSKLLLALVPPNTPFWRMDLDAKTKAEIEENTQLKGQIEVGISRYERSALSEIEATGDRTTIFEGLKHLIVGGNVLLYDSEGGLRAFPLDRYVIKRDPMGRVIEIIIKEAFDRQTLPEEVQGIISNDGSMATKASEMVDLYTAITINPAPEGAGQYWSVWQEMGNGETVPKSQGYYKKDELPFLPLRLVKIDGEDYGRGFVEEYIGDIKSLEGLSQAMVEGSAAAAKVVFLVNPNGTTRASALTKTRNGGVASGNANDVTVLQVQKQADFNTVLQTMQAIESRLDFVFLNHSSVQRNAERVTAEEVRFMAQELEDALGGVYSVLSQEFQRPYVELKLRSFEKAGKLKALPKGVVNITIVAGLEALGRGHDRNKLVQYLATLGNLGGPEVIAKYVNLGELTRRLAISDGIDTIGLIRSDEEIQAAEQQAQMTQMAEQLGPEAVKQMGQQAQQQQQQPEE